MPFGGEEGIESSMRLKRNLSKAWGNWLPELGRLVVGETGNSRLSAKPKKENAFREIMPIEKEGSKGGEKACKNFFSTCELDLGRGKRKEGPQGGTSGAGAYNILHQGRRSTANQVLEWWGLIHSSEGEKK